MNSVTRRLANYGIYCDSQKSEVCSGAGTTMMWGYQLLLGLRSLDVWVVGQGVASIGFNRPDSVNELIDRFGDKPRRNSQCQRRN